MIAIAKGLYVGDEGDCGSLDALPDYAKWSVVHACKEPFHRHAVGYSGRAAPKNDPEYLVAMRRVGSGSVEYADTDANRIMLNMVDVDNPAYFQPYIFAAALLFIDRRLAAGDNVLVHCNQGASRGPGVALAWLRKRMSPYRDMDYEHAVDEFRLVYPDFQPRAGISGWLRQNWDLLRDGGI